MFKRAYFMKVVFADHFSSAAAGTEIDGWDVRVQPLRLTAVRLWAAI